MTVEKVTLKMLRSLKLNGWEIYQLPTVKACYSARSLVHHVQKTDGYKIKTKADYNAKTVIVMRTA